MSSTMKYSNVTLGEVEAVWNKLGGEDGVARFLRGEMAITSFGASKPRSILRRIEGATDLALPATKGQRLLSEQKTLFFGWIDPDLTNWGLNVPGVAKSQTSVEVCELTENATFEQMLPGEGVDLDKLCLTQDQIITFVENHREHLHPEGWATFFLFKVSGQFFVADVSWYDGARKLKVYVNRLSSDDVWLASNRYRFVLPQLAL